MSQKNPGYDSHSTGSTVARVPGDPTFGSVCSKASGRLSATDHFPFWFTEQCLQYLDHTTSLAINAERWWNGKFWSRSSELHLKNRPSAFRWSRDSSTYSQKRANDMVHKRPSGQIINRNITMKIQQVPYKTCIRFTHARCDDLKAVKRKIAVFCDLVLWVLSIRVSFKAKHTTVFTRIEETHTLKMEAVRNSQTLPFLRAC